MKLTIQSAMFAFLGVGEIDPGSTLWFFGSVLYALGCALLWILALLPLCVLLYLVYFLISLPLRRQERARFFLDLLETGLKSGRGLEQTIVSISQSRDRSVGVRFHLFAAHLERGLSLRQALERVPRLLPPQIVAMLKVGEEVGDLRKILPACRALLHDGVGQVRKAHNYLVVLVFVITPLWMFVFAVLSAVILPKFHEIAIEFEATIPPLLSNLAQHKTLLFTFHGVLMVLLYAGAFLYIGGPRVLGWVEAGLPKLSDWIFHRLPWRRKRLHRDFSIMLAILLDAGVPEEKAVSLAADSTANNVIRRRAALVAEELRRGVKLTEAMRHLDDAGEFKWRLAQAAHGQGGFRAALVGWHEALDAKAFQQEQGATHTLTSALVLYNGVIVGLIVIGLFQVLLSITEAALLW